MNPNEMRRRYAYMLRLIHRLQLCKEITYWNTCGAAILHIAKVCK